MDCSGQQWWCVDHWLHGDSVHLDYSADTGFVCVGESVHDHWSDQWHGVHVHGDGNKLCRHWCCVSCVCCSHALDGSWCTDVGVGNVECEWSVSSFMDCTGQHWGCVDQRLHGDPVCFDDGSDAGVLCVGESVHDHWSHERHCVHVHGCRDERVGYGCFFDGFGLGDSFDGSWCTDVG